MVVFALENRALSACGFGGPVTRNWQTRFRRTFIVRPVPGKRLRRLLAAVALMRGRRTLRPTRIGRPLLAILLVSWGLYVGFLAASRCFPVRSLRPTVSARGSDCRIWVVRQGHSLAVVVRFFVPADYQPLRATGQRVVGSYEPETRPADVAGRLRWTIPPLWKRTEQRSSLVKPVVRPKFFTMP